jgi:hypothetical protein
MKEDKGEKVLEEYMRKQRQAAFDSIDWEAEMEKTDSLQRPERVARWKWVHFELPKLAESKSTSVGYPVGPWFAPQQQAKDCYIHGFFRAVVAMCGSIAENICLNLLLTIIGGDKSKYERLTLGQLIVKISKHIVFSDIENVDRLTEIKDKRNKWVHMKSNNWALNPTQIQEEQTSAKQDAERVLVLVHRILSSVFELRPANGGMLELVILAQKKQRQK